MDHIDQTLSIVYQKCGAKISTILRNEIEKRGNVIRKQNTQIKNYIYLLEKANVKFEKPRTVVFNINSFRGKGVGLIESIELPTELQNDDFVRTLVNKPFNDPAVDMYLKIIESDGYFIAINHKCRY
jgi:hypothetical protein